MNMLQDDIAHCPTYVFFHNDKPKFPRRTYVTCIYTENESKSAEPLML